MRLIELGFHFSFINVEYIFYLLYIKFVATAKGGANTIENFDCKNFKGRLIA